MKYVTSLRERRNGSKEVGNLKVVDVVFIADDNVAPLQWPLRSIRRVYSGPDNFVGVFKVGT